MLSALHMETSTSALQQLCEHKESTAPVTLFSRRMAAAFSAHGKPADDIAQINRSTVTVSSRSLHKSARGLMPHSSVDERASKVAKCSKPVVDAMSPESALLLELITLGFREIDRRVGVKRHLMVSGISREMLRLYVKDNGMLSARGKAVIFSDAIIRWMKPAVRKRDTSGVRAFCASYKMDSEEFLRHVTISGLLRVSGVGRMTRGGYEFHPVTEQLLVTWLLLRKSSINRKSDLEMFCKEYTLPPCSLRGFFYKNGDLNDRGWRVLGMLKRRDLSPILDVHRQQWSQLTPQECNQLGYDGFAGIHKIDQSAWRSRVIKEKLSRPGPRRYEFFFR